MRELTANWDTLERLIIEALKEVPPLRSYDCCPKCGSTPIEWNPSRRRHHCLYRGLYRSCGWEEEKESLPLRSYLTGRPLSSREILAMVLEYLMRK